MPEPALEQTVLDGLRAVLSSVTDPLVVTLSGDTVEALLAVLADLDEPSVRLLAPGGVLRDVLDDFLVASAAADFVAADRLELRTGDIPSMQLIVAADMVVAFVTAGDRVAGLTTGDEAFVASATDHYADLWAAADPFTLHTPPRARVQRTLDAEFGPAVAADFDAILAALETVRGDGDGLDEVTISLLVAAKHEELLYDISTWGGGISALHQRPPSRGPKPASKRWDSSTPRLSPSRWGARASACCSAMSASTRPALRTSPPRPNRSSRPTHPDRVGRSSR